MKSPLNLQMIVFTIFTSLLSSPSSASSSPPPPSSQSRYSSSSSSSLVSTAARAISTHQHHHQQQPRRTELHRLHRQNWTRPPPSPPVEGQEHEWRQRRRDLRAFKAALLRILGLASEPRPQKAGDGRRVIPGYMWELYDRMKKSNKDNAVKRPTKVTKRDGKRPPFDADTVRCFEALNAGRKNQRRKSRGGEMVLQ